MNESQKELIKNQFLEEAQDYIKTIESGLLGISRDTIDHKNIDEILRSAHSLKGGAALMEYHELSHYAHRLEDFFKILKIGTVSPDNEIENIFLRIVDYLVELINSYIQKQTDNYAQIQAQIDPLLSKLHERLGDFNPEDEQALLAQNAEMDEDEMSIFLFETEVEDSLTRLENLSEQNDLDLYEHFSNFLIELSGLAQMIDLSSLTEFCESVEAALQEQNVSQEIIVQLALQQLRKIQALVLAKQSQLLPTEFRLNAETTSIEFFVNEADDLSLVPDDQELERENWLETEQPSEILELLEDNERQLDFVTSPVETVSPQLIENFGGTRTSIHTANSTVQENKINQEQEYQATNIKVPAHKLRELEILFNELNIDRNALDSELKNIRILLDNLREKLNDLDKNNFQLRTLYDQVSTISLHNTSQKIDSMSKLSHFPVENLSFDLLEMDKYSDWHILAQEIMENIVQIKEIRNDLDVHLKDTETVQRSFQRTSKFMQKNMTEISMRPFSELLQQFPRALRQMELDYGKQVNFKVTGSNTLVEKNILARLNDPLLHLFRNAFDHGIETPEVRRVQGKSPEGMIEINASYRGNKTVITIRDDGHGIDLNKIIAKAKEMGLDDDDIAKISQKELLDLIFEPGFSTSAQVTDLSGRGVGMDVVKNNLQEIGGDITVETQLGVGTTFSLSVPFTLSLVKVLLVEVNNLLLAVPSNLVEEVELLDDELISFHPKSMKPQSSGKYSDDQWEKIRLIELSDYLQFNYRPPSQEIDAMPLIDQPTVLIIKKNDDLIGFKVDRYWAEQEVSIRQVENYLPLPEGFSGCTILGNGVIIPLVDTIELVNAIQKQDLVTKSLDQDSLKDQSLLAKKNDDNLILTVDDSINVRRFLSLTLEKANYLVEQAKDGQEGLEKLQSGIRPKLIICDVEMPRLDGFGFLAHVKNNPDLKDIPVMMLTSRSGEKHRKIAANLGANAYFTKPFQEQLLLQTIESLIAVTNTPKPEKSFI